MTINDVPAALGQAIRDQVAEIEEVAVTTWPRRMVVAHHENSFTEDVLFADPSFVSIFSLKDLHVSNSLTANNSILVSRHLANKIFSGDAVGNTIRLEDRDELVVSGVYENFPANSEFAGVDLIAPLAYHFARNPRVPSPHDWETYVFQCYVLLDRPTSLLKAQNDMKSILFDHASNDGKALLPDGVLLPMRDWHLRSEFRDGRISGGRIQMVNLVALISVMIILLACVNFINLTTALTQTRAKEIGIRKVIGSQQWDLIRRFLLESLVLVAIAFGIAVMASAVALPWFNKLSGKQIVFPLTVVSFWGAAFIFIIVVTLLSGTYPAFLAASRDVSQLLKRRVGEGNGIHGIALRKSLVIFQFAVSVVLIIGAQVIHDQISHARNRPTGFDTEGIVHVAIRSDQLANLDYNTLRQGLFATGVVENAAKSDFPITGAMAGDASIRWEDMELDSPPLFARNRCSHDFPATHGFQFVSGRDFSRDHPSDSSAVIINEMAARLIDGDVLGKKITFGYDKEREIIGVIKDQIRWGPYHEQAPHLYYVGYDNSRYYSIRLKSDVAVADALSKIKSVFAGYAPATPFEYAFVADDYNKLFVAGERTGEIALIFSGLAILISCVGIFGLAAFSASRRTKEIGVRKVVGASSYQIWKLLSVEFFGLSSIAILIACPIAYKVSNVWLEQFSYRIAPTWIVFVIATVITLIVTLGTVSYQTLRAAAMNPAKSLRND